MRFGGRRARRVIFTALATVVIAGLAYGGWIWWLYRDAERAVRDPSLDEVITEPPEDEEPFFALLVGSDSREGLTEEEKYRLGADDVNPDGTPITGERADALILVRVDPAADRLTMVSFPRDLYVTYPDGSTGKINGALDRSRRFLVNTVESVTGLELNRYAQVNIAGFGDLVDAIGGVDVCIPEPIDFDDATGFELKPDEVGIVHLDGEEALRYVRTRKVLDQGDFDRIANQQKMLAAAIQKVGTLGTIGRPDRVHGLFDAVKDSVKTDSYSSLGDLRSLAERFKVLSSDKLDVFLVPNKGSALIGAADVVLPATNKMNLLFDALGVGILDSATKGKLASWKIDVPVSGSVPAVCRQG